MKVWVMAGLFTVAMTPMAFAAEDTSECQLDEQRRVAEQRADTPAPATAARPTVAQREIAIPPPITARGGVERRRNGKPIPDARLIGPRGAL